MKKTLIRLFVLSLAATSLTGCDLFSEKSVDHLELKNYKTATLLNSNYKFDGQVFAVYEDDSKEDVTSKATYSTLDTSQLGNSLFKVTYETRTQIRSKSVYIKVVDSFDLTTIDIEDYSETAEVGTEYVFDGKVIATYNDGSSKEVTEKAVVSPLDTSKKGTSQLVVSYTENGITKDVIKPIEVLSLLKSIKITGQTNTYILNEEFKFDGRVKATYSDGSVVDITDYVTIDSSNIDTSKIGIYTLKASYKDGELVFEDNIQISVIARIPNLLSIEASGYSTEVNKKEKYAFDGVVTATFDEGPTADVTKDATFSSISTLTTGKKTLTITYIDPRTNIKRTTTIEIEVVARVSEIQVPETLKVKTGSTSQLSPVVLPSEAKNKGVTFSSSDVTVATIDKTGLISGLKPGTTVITVTSDENKEITAQTTVNVSDIVLADWSIFLYVCGSNLESEAAEATTDLAEIDKVTGKPDDVNIVVEAGGANTWQNYSSIIDASKLNRFHLTSGSYVKDEQIASDNMGKSSTLQSFLEWGIDKYPAEKSALILWNHGGGLAGCCQDEIYNDMLTDDEVISAVDGAFRNTGTTKFEWIGYDCCLMQTMEVAEFNSTYFNYQIASQEVESGYGWSYDNWIDYVYKKKSTETILTQIVDSFIESLGGEDAASQTYYDSSQHAYVTYYPNQTLSYLDLSKMADFKDAWEILASKTKIKSSTYKNQFLSSLVENVQHFGGDSYKYYGEIDCYDYLVKLKESSKFNPGDDYVNAAQEALSSLIKHNKAQKSGCPNAYGLSCCFSSDLNFSDYSNFNEWIALMNYVGGYRYW